MDVKNYTYDHYLDGECGILDAHVHLGKIPYAKEFADAVNEGENAAVSFGQRPQDFDSDIKLAGKNVEIGAGYHPWDIDDKYSQNLELAQVNFEKCDFVGEIGLDFSPKRKKHSDAQIAVFDEYANWLSKADGKTVSIHAFKSEDKIVEILKKHNVFKTDNTLIFHWYHGSYQQLQIALKLGFYFSSGPKMINTNNGHMLISEIPEDRLLVETDLPWDNEPIIYSDYCNIINDYLMQLRDIKFS